jgi:hypothetical protein
MSNAAQGHGMRLASNRWINIELGLLRPPASEQPSEIYAQYRRDANGVGSEEGSRARVIEHLATQSSFQILGSQISKWMWMVGRSTSFLERSIYNDRWGAEAGAGLRGLGILGRGMWYLIFALGMVGAAVHGMRSSGWGLLALVVLYFSVALLAIPIKVRFAMPLVPILCLFCGAMAERGMNWFKRPDPRRESTSSQDG